MVCEFDVEFPQASVAVQVRVMVYVSAHTPGVVLSSKLTVGDPSQLSVTVTVAAVGTASQATVTFPGTPARTGAVLSFSKQRGAVLRHSGVGGGSSAKNHRRRV